MVAIMSIVTLGATFDGTALVTIIGGQPRIMLRCVRGLDDSPEVRGTDTIVPGLAGRIVRSRVRDRRVIELAGWVMGTGTTEADQREDVRDALEELRALFDPTRTPATLLLELEDGGFATISARPLSTVMGDDPIPTYRALSVELEAVEADWTIIAPALRITLLDAGGPGQNARYSMVVLATSGFYGIYTDAETDIRYDVPDIPYDTVAIDLTYTIDVSEYGTAPMDYEGVYCTVTGTGTELDPFIIEFIGPYAAQVVTFGEIPLT